MSLEDNNIRCMHGIRPSWCVKCTPTLPKEPAPRREITPPADDTMCLRNCGRKKDNNRHRSPEGELSDWCQQCKKAGKARVKNLHGDPNNLAQLLDELRRLPEHGVMPGVTIPRTKKTP